VWAEIEHDGDVRNQIMHDDGRRTTRARLPAGEKDLKKDRSDRVDAYVRSREADGKTGITFNRDTLVLTPEFCREALEVLRGFFKELIEVIPD
jgi:hypothetical protein